MNVFVCLGLRRVSGDVEILLDSRFMDCSVRLSHAIYEVIVWNQVIYIEIV